MGLLDKLKSKILKSDNNIKKLKGFGIKWK